MFRYSPHFQQLRCRVENELSAALTSEDKSENTLTLAMRYACQAGGKRLRPVLLLEFTELCAGDVAQALSLAAAVEMIHCYSLVHDDLPCMDNSLIRRGKPSVFAAYGEDMALLAGDALLTRAFEWMMRPSGVPAENVLTAAGILARAAGVDGMVGGQMMDLQFEGKSPELSKLRLLHGKKTAALIAAACEMGVVAAGGNEEQRRAARTYGVETGLCFQIVDDLLDVTSSPDTLGKPTGADEKNGKATYPALIGIDAAREAAHRHVQAATRALRLFGDAADALIALTWALYTRES